MKDERAWCDAHRQAHGYDKVRCPECEVQKIYNGSLRLRRFVEALSKGGCISSEHREGPTCIVCDAKTLLHKIDGTVPPPEPPPEPLTEFQQLFADDLKKGLDAAIERSISRAVGRVVKPKLEKLFEEATTCPKCTSKAIKKNAHHKGGSFFCLNCTHNWGFMEVGDGAKDA